MYYLACLTQNHKYLHFCSHSCGMDEWWGMSFLTLSKMEDYGEFMRWSSIWDWEIRLWSNSAADQLIIIIVIIIITTIIIVCACRSDRWSFIRWSADEENGIGCHHHQWARSWSSSSSWVWWANKTDHSSGDQLIILTKPIIWAVRHNHHLILDSSAPNIWEIFLNLLLYL